jgi:hypothetical protein
MARTTIICRTGDAAIDFKPSWGYELFRRDQDVFRTVWGNFLCE